MLEDLKSLIFGKAKGKAPILSANHAQLAEAALLFHVIAADGVVSDIEKARLSDLLSARFGLDIGDTNNLVAEARRADNEAIDLFAFVRTLRRELDQAARLLLVRGLWEMVYADGEVHEFEDNIVWRVADLLDIPARDRMALKQLVRQATTGPKD